MEPVKGEQRLIAISGKTLVKVNEQIAGCEGCTPDADVPLSWVMDGVTGHSGASTDYVRPHPIKCPRCFAEITEETLVKWD